MGGYGYADGSTLDIENVNATLGMNMGNTEASELIASDESCEIPGGYRPLFCVEDADAEVISSFDNGKVAVAKKGNTVYCALPYLTKATAREVLQKAGVHLWTNSGEPVNVGFGYAVLNCQRAGERPFFLKNGKEITVKTENFETVVINLATGEIS